jgi:hypothetical protein
MYVLPKNYWFGWKMPRNYCGAYLGVCLHTREAASDSCQHEKCNIVADTGRIRATACYSTRSAFVVSKSN